MNGILSFILLLSAEVDSANTMDNIIEKNGYDILTVIILAVVFIALITIFIYKKKNKK